ncbi:MAG TPA: DUF3467 domain-containing protein [Dehalococcoidia bacterium]|nr:DUF3467 domain-containing protein [Dehalococcoidia bacterium]
MPDEVPEVYSDQVQIAQSAYGLTLIFGTLPATPTGPGPQIMERRAIVRMSLEHAKVLSMMLRKQLKQFELEHLGDPIRLPREVLSGIGLTEEDW